MAKDKRTEVTVAHLLLETLTSDNPNKRVQLVNSYIERNLRKGVAKNETVAKGQDELQRTVPK